MPSMSAGKRIPRVRTQLSATWNLSPSERGLRNTPSSVGPSGIGLFDGIVHAIDERREADPQSAHTAIGHLESFALGARIAEHHALANVAAHLPDVAGVRLLDIDGVEGHAIPIGIEQSIERGNLPAKGRSSVASEDQ